MQGSSESFAAEVVSNSRLIADLRKHVRENLSIVEFTHEEQSATLESGEIKFLDSERARLAIDDANKVPDGFVHKVYAQRSDIDATWLSQSYTGFFFNGTKITENPHLFHVYTAITGRSLSVPFEVTLDRGKSTHPLNIDRGSFKWMFGLTSSRDGSNLHHLLRWPLIEVEDKTGNLVIDYGKLGYVDTYLQLPNNDETSTASQAKTPSTTQS